MAVRLFPEVNGILFVQTWEKNISVRFSYLLVFAAAVY